MGKEKKEAMKRAALRQDGAPGSPTIIEEPASPSVEEKLAMLETMLQKELAVIFEELRNGAAEAEKNCECEMKKGEEQLKQLKEKLEAAAPEPMKEKKEAMKRAALRQEGAPGSPTIIEEPASPSVEEKLAMLETMLQKELAVIFE